MFHIILSLDLRGFQIHFNLTLFSQEAFCVPGRLLSNQPFKKPSRSFEGQRRKKLNVIVESIIVIVLIFRLNYSIV